MVWVAVILYSLFVLQLPLIESFFLLPTSIWGIYEEILTFILRVLLKTSQFARDNMHLIKSDRTFEYCVMKLIGGLKL